MRTPIGTGWLARQEAAKAALQSRYHPIADDPVSQERRALYDAQAEADRLAREAAEARITDTVTQCPCCAGKGHLVVAEAAKVVEALRRYDFVGWKPDVVTVAELMRTAIVVDRDGKPITETVSPSTMGEDGTGEIAAETVEDEAIAQATGAKPSRRR